MYLQQQAAEISIIQAWHTMSNLWGEPPAVVCVGLQVDSMIEVDAPKATLQRIQIAAGTRVLIRPISRCKTHPVFGRVIDEEGRPAWSIVYADVDVVLRENKALMPDGVNWEQRRAFNHDRIVSPSKGSHLFADSNGRVRFDGVATVTDGFDTEWYYLDLSSRDGVVSIVTMKRDRLIH